MNNKAAILLRILCAVLSGAAILWGSWIWIGIIAIVGLFFIYPYYEIMLWGMVVDTLYGTSSLSIGYTLAAFVLFVIASIIRRRVRDTM